mmetsp:Transcript_63266/g.135968  ORF Transcript_63266/g.135968 Transcript_63266/m.135968 type:complete len:227 (-) Transcript_63266:444-1124(-)
MLPPLPLAVQLDEALRAEEIYAILAEHRSIVVLALEADEAIDHPLEVVAQLRSGGIKGVDVHKPLVGVEQPALHALACRDTVLIGCTDELLDIRGNVRTALACGMGAVEAILAEEVFALLALHDGRLLLALLAHNDARRLPDNVHLVLLLADRPQEFYGIAKVLHDARQIELLLNIGLERLLHRTKKEEFLRAVDAEELSEPLHYLGCRGRQALRRAAHDLRSDGS